MPGGGKESKKRRQLLRSGLAPDVAAKQAAEEFADVRRRQAEIEGAGRSVAAAESNARKERDKRKREQKAKASELAANQNKKTTKVVEPMASDSVGTTKTKGKKEAIDVAVVAVVKKTRKVVFSDNEDEAEIRKDSEPKLKKKKATNVEVSHLEAPSAFGKKKSEFIAFVGQLPFDATAESVKTHFINNGISKCRVRILTERETDKSRGMAFVTLNSEEDLQAALNLHQSELNGRWINVERSGKSPKRKDIELTSITSGGPSAPDKNMSVFVAQLPFKADESSIRKYFEDAGVQGIVGVRMLSEKGTNKKGMAFVRLSDEKGVQAAIKLNESQFDNRWIRVERSGKKEAQSRAAEEMQLELYAEA